MVWLPDSIFEVPPAPHNVFRILANFAKSVSVKAKPEATVTIFPLRPLVLRIILIFCWAAGKEVRGAELATARFR